jgi:hypothetical protein
MRDIETEAGRLFEHPAVEFIHVRSSTNNCYHFRIEQQPDCLEVVVFVAALPLPCDFVSQASISQGEKL